MSASLPQLKKKKKRKSSEKNLQNLKIESIIIFYSLCIRIQNKLSNRKTPHLQNVPPIQLL